MSYAKKRDDNESEIVKRLRKAGCKVHHLDDWDLLVRHPWTRDLYMLEVKQDGGELTKNQKKMIERGWPLHVVLTPEEALAVVGLTVEEM